MNEHASITGRSEEFGKTLEPGSRCRSREIDSSPDRSGVGAGTGRACLDAIEGRTRGGSLAQDVEGARSRSGACSRATRRADAEEEQATARASPISARRYDSGPVEVVPTRAVENRARETERVMSPPDEQTEAPTGSRVLAGARARDPLLRAGRAAPLRGSSRQVREGSIDPFPGSWGARRQEPSATLCFVYQQSPNMGRWSPTFRRVGRATLAFARVNAPVRSGRARPGALPRGCTPGERHGRGAKPSETALAEAFLARPSGASPDLARPPGTLLACSPLSGATARRVDRERCPRRTTRRDRHRQARRAAPVRRRPRCLAPAPIRFAALPAQA